MSSLQEAKKRFRHTMWLLAAFSFVVNMLLLTMPLYMLQIYDRILPSNSMDTLAFLSVMAIAALIVLGTLESVRAMLAARAATKLEVVLGEDAMRASMNSGRSAGAGIEPVRHLAAVRQFISSRALFALLDMPFAPIFIGLLYVIHPTLFWLTLSGAAVLFAIALLNQRVTSGPAMTSSNAQQHAAGIAQSVSASADTLRAMGMMKNGISNWAEHNAQTLVSQGVVDSRNAVLSGLSKTLRMGLQIAILGVGALLVLNGEMTAGMIFAASIISGRALQPIDQVIGGWKQFVSAHRAWKGLEQALATVPKQPEKTQMAAPRGELDADSVLVIADQGLSRAPILNRLNFKLGRGEILGVVGPSGSGKSTLARVLVGAQNLNAGHIRIDGTDVQNWDSEQLGQHIGYLGQEIELLPGTVKQNIARLSSRPDDKAVLEAAEKAQVHKLIQNLPNGYDTIIGPGGLGLSGGQRQRIGLARAFYGNPQIMVLDEPNANLDDDGERALHRAIVAARDAGVTAVIITQRKPILNIVDKILRLHSGSIDYFGTREEFVARLRSMKEQEVDKKSKKPQTSGKRAQTMPGDRLQKSMAAYQSNLIKKKG